MPRASVLLRFLVALATLLGLGALVAVQPAAAARGHVAAPRTATAWTPSPVPMPTLPGGGTAVSAVLYGSSCSSTAFCVAVGTANYHFPLVETYSGGSWTASIAPLPAGGGTNGTLYSVSCPSDGTCAAVGAYNDPSFHQDGLLDTLSGGTWTPTQAGQASTGLVGLVNLNSVSCANASTCMAVGTDDNASWNALIYVLRSGTWQLDSAPPMPSNYTGNGLSLESVSCPDASDCVVVGTYDSNGLILTLSSGSWTAQQAPVPNGTQSTGPVGLNAVDCPGPSDCVAGGFYSQSATTQNALFDTLQSGTWSASEAPVPAGASPYQWAEINGISCPATGACMADGTVLNVPGTQESGMLLSQSGTTWSAVPAPVPVTAGPSASASRALNARTTTRLQGISCARTGFCRAVGSHGKHPLIEKLGRTHP
jgi:hypothetical protein